MNIVDKVEDTLKGGYGGLVGEVVTCDMYRLRQLPFKPDIVFDIGANVGVFTRFAKSLWPAVKVVAVEPNPENCIHFRRFTLDPGVLLLEKALGPGGPVYHGLTACNGAGETYLSPGLGFSKEDLKKCESVEAVELPTVMLDDLVIEHGWPGMKSVMKIDCEGAENCIWGHRCSMNALRAMTYITIELHDYSLTAKGIETVVEQTKRALQSLEATHTCARDGVYFWATKKTI